MREVTPRCRSLRWGCCRAMAARNRGGGSAPASRLLRAEGVDLPDDLDTAGEVPTDDVLDAAAAAWSAHRIARGDAKSLPDPPQLNDRGQTIAIWY